MNCLSKKRTYQDNNITFGHLVLIKKELRDMKGLTRGVILSLNPA
jgi:hypothetical protein